MVMKMVGGAISALHAEEAKTSALVPAIADGKPWQMTTSDGKKMRLTINPNNTGTMEMFVMKRAITWKPTPTGFCINGTPQGEKCLVLEKTAHGYKGKGNDGLSMTLIR